jgi:hypothetical protein
MPFEDIVLLLEYYPIMKQYINFEYGKWPKNNDFLAGIIMALV